MTEIIHNPSRALTADQFQNLQHVPAANEWFANIGNEHTREAYRRDVQSFFAFIGLQEHEELKRVTRAHVIAWRKSLEQEVHEPSTIRRKLSALSSLYHYLCECNAVAGNPVHGVKRPRHGQNIGKTPALSLTQARELRKAPTGDSLLAIRDRAIFATLYFHALRVSELCGLRVKDLQNRHGYYYLEIHGKGSKLRYVELHSEAQEAILAYLTLAGHRDALKTPLFRPTRNNHTQTLDKAIDRNTVYRIVKKYGGLTGVGQEVIGLTTHSLRATAATIAIDHGSDIKRVAEWMGHSNVSTTQLYDHRHARPEDSPTFRVKS